MSDFFVMLVLKTVIRRGGLLDFQNYTSLELKHSISNNNIMDIN